MTFAETRHEARLDFSEPTESLTTRLRELSGTRLPVGRGLIPRSQVRFEGDELRVSEFGRTLLRGRVEPQPRGCSLVLSTSAPFLKAGVYLWRFTMVPGFFLITTTIVGGYGFDETILGGFLFAGLVGTFVFPALWGRRWEFHRLAAALSGRLHANNDSEMQSTNHTSSLARGGAWTSGLSSFLWAPLLAINGFPVPLVGSHPSTAPWVNWRAFLTESLEIDGAMLFLFLFVGWAFAGGGAICGHAVAKFLPTNRPQSCRWTTTVLALATSLWLCWLISGSKTLDRMFYIP